MSRAIDWIVTLWRCSAFIGACSGPARMSTPDLCRVAMLVRMLSSIRSILSSASRIVKRGSKSSISEICPKGRARSISATRFFVCIASCTARFRATVLVPTPPFEPVTIVARSAMVIHDTVLLLPLLRSETDPKIGARVPRRSSIWTARRFKLLCAERKNT